jgi:uncharacterized protein YwgA
MPRAQILHENFLTIHNKDMDMFVYEISEYLPKISKRFEPKISKIFWEENFEDFRRKV